MTLKLVSFDLCPFVQRSVIVLLEKQMDYEITYLSFEELQNPPQWFSDISPMHKVPVLRVDGVTLFESSVIMEYLDEISPPSLHPADPLQRALNRAWIKFGEELIFTQYRYATSANEETFQQNRQELSNGLQRLENVIAQDGPFFNGAEFRLIDAAYASFFMRLDILEGQCAFGCYDNRPKLATWAAALRDRDTVKNSVVPNLAEKYLDFLSRGGEYAAKMFAPTLETA